MFSKVFLAYVLLALGAVPAFLLADEAPGAAGHSPSPSANTSGASTSNNTSPSAAHPPANATTVPTTGGNHSETVPGQVPKLPGNNTAPDSPPTTTCFPRSKSHGVEDHHCRKALDKIVYAANQTLDKFSSIIFVNYKTCNVHLRKPRNGTVTKLDISSLVNVLNGACHSTGGLLTQTSKKITLRIERATKENTHEVDSPVCKKETCPLIQSDCLTAFYQLPVDGKGMFVQGKGSHPFARVTSGNCTVTASTTDLSAFTIQRQFIVPTMKKLLQQCEQHPGKIFYSGGTKGYNGDIWLSVRAANKELCQ